jgi:hypothetical protein
MSCLVAGACQSSPDDETTPSVTLAGTPVDFTSETENEEIGVLGQGDVVGMTVINELTGEVTTVNAQFVVDANGLLVGVNNITFPSTGAAISIFAYSPYQEDWDDLTDEGYRTFELPTDQLLYEQYHSADFIVGLPEGGNPVTRSDVKIIFSHAFAQVNLELTDPDAATSLSTASVGIGPLATSAYVNPRTGEVTAIPTETCTVTPYPTLSSHYSESGDAVRRTPELAVTRSDRRETYSAIVIPQQLGQGAPFLEVRTASRTFKFALPEDVDWQSGMSYDYGVEITADGINLVSTGISKWTEGTGGNLELEEDQ